MFKYRRRLGLDRGCVYVLICFWCEEDDIWLDFQLDAYFSLMTMNVSEFMQTVEEKKSGHFVGVQW